jgi:hypothetical protein
LVLLAAVGNADGGEDFGEVVAGRI